MQITRQLAVVGTPVFVVLLLATLGTSCRSRGPVDSLHALAMADNPAVVERSAAIKAVEQVYPYRISPGDVIGVAYFKQPAAFVDQAYRVNCDDALTINVIGQESYSLDVTVRPDGCLSFHLIGDVPVRGLTVAEIRATLTERLQARIPAVEVSVFLRRGGVIVDEFLNTLMGDKRQGTSRQVTVKRDGLASFPLLGERAVVGKSLTELAQDLELEYQTLFQGGLTVNANLVSGETGNVVVLGEVRKPGLYTVPRAMHPVFLLAMAGGARETADVGAALVVRRGPDGQVTRLDPQLDVQRETSGALDATIVPGDILLVPKSPIANIDQFVDQYIRKIIPVNLSAGAYYDLDQE